jgi:hypothetical protein
LPCKETGAPGLEIKGRGTRSTASISRFRNSLEELAGASVFTLVEGKICFLQNGRDFLGEGLPYVTAEYAPH